MFSKPSIDAAQAEKGPVDRDNASCRVASAIETSQDLLDGENTDVVLLGKMRLLNDAIDEIGWTTFHLKLFCLSGFGYAVDTLVAMLQSIIAAQAYAELGAANGGYPTGLTLSLYAGFLVGALFWGFSADIIGRRIAFNTTLFGSSISAIVAGAAPNWPVLGLFIAFLGFSAGGNLVIDPTVFLEFLPGNKQWLVTAMATWWGVGQAAAGFLAWGYFSRSEWSCDTSDPSSCTWQNNKGWRLIMFTGGSVILVMSIVRLLVFRLHETPKYMLSAGRDAELVEQLQALAIKYHRPFSLTVERLEACGTIETKSTRKRSCRNIAGQLVEHLKGLMVTPKLALSTGLVWLSWTLIGLGYPLFFIFLP
ncbi:Filamentous Growth Regulator [Neonectria punicea]|uniref:Filamentous Growth Regulator n=1 Tax=Neonectria punicea TaxID=979145 RepID=A0ABR1HAW4_9HYPO